MNPTNAGTIDAVCPIAGTCLGQVLCEIDLEKEYDANRVGGSRRGDRHFLEAQPPARQEDQRKGDEEVGLEGEPDAGHDAIQNGKPATRRVASRIGCAQQKCELLSLAKLPWKGQGDEDSQSGDHGHTIGLVCRLPKACD